jgi:hypothetical protein
VGANASSELPHLFDQLLPRHSRQVLVHTPSVTNARRPTPAPLPNVLRLSCKARLVISPYDSRRAALCQLQTPVSPLSYRDTSTPPGSKVRQDCCAF